MEILNRYLYRPSVKYGLKPALYLIVGVIIGHFAGWDFVDSLYFAVITSTTVGFGDYTVMSSEADFMHRDVAKILCMIYMFAGLVVVGDLISEMATNIVSSTLAKFQSTTEYDRFVCETDSERSKRYSKRQIKAYLMIVSAISIGAAFIKWNEKLTVVDAFYWSTQTVTTIGYGDIALKHESSRVFCCVFIPVAVATVSGVIAELANVRLDQQQDDRRQKLLSLELTDSLAAEIDDHVDEGVISEAAFVRYMLVQEGLVSKRDYDRYLNHFRNDFELDNAGKLFYKSTFEVGLRVKITKVGSQEGKTATVVNNNWNGLVKVAMEETGVEKSYKKTEIALCVPKGNGQTNGKSNGQTKDKTPNTGYTVSTVDSTPRASGPSPTPTSTMSSSL
jgi:hypothetical protein